MNAEQLARDLRLLRTVVHAASTVADNLELSPGGDEYKYVGHTALIDDLKRAIDEYEYRAFKERKTA